MNENSSTPWVDNEAHPINIYGAVTSKFTNSLSNTKHSGVVPLPTITNLDMFSRRNDNIFASSHNIKAQNIHSHTLTRNPSELITVSN